MFMIGHKVRHYMLGEGDIVHIDYKTREAKVMFKVCPSFAHNGGINPCWVNFNNIELIENDDPIDNFDDDDDDDPIDDPIDDENDNVMRYDITIENNEEEEEEEQGTLFGVQLFNYKNKESFKDLVKILKENHPAFEMNRLPGNLVEVNCTFFDESINDSITIDAYNISSKVNQCLSLLGM